MPDLSLQRRLARHVLTKNLRVEPGENVTIDTWNHGLPIARALVIESRRIGAHPLLLLNDEEAFWDSHNEGLGREVGRWGKHEIEALKKTNAYVYVWGPENLPKYDRLPESTRRRLTAYNDQWYDVAKRSGVRAVRLEVGHATGPEAFEFGADLDRWQSELYAATLVDPGQLERIGETLRKPLGRRAAVSIRHKNGTNLELRLFGQNPRLHVGRSENHGRRARLGFIINVPGGAVHAALDETRAEGLLVANRPTYLDSSRYLGGRWTFHHGRLTGRSFTSGGDAFEIEFKRGKSGRDRPGALCIGFNPKIHDSPRAEDLEMGVVCIALGYNLNLGGRNASPTFLYLTLAGADVDVGGIPLLRRGRIVPGATGPR
jgi:leucyl aminopeptidase (aminopeptidase T)